MRQEQVSGARLEGLQMQGNRLYSRDHHVPAVLSGPAHLR